MTDAATWENPPNQRVIHNVSAGSVVLVRFWPTDPNAALIADANGVLPHVVFRATLAPQGTTAFQRFVEDPITGTVQAVDGTQGERPTTNLDGALSIDNNQNDFDLDPGQAIFFPYSGTLSLVGGAFPGGVAAKPYQVSVQTVTPRTVDMEYADPVSVGVGALFKRHLFHQTGLIPRKRPTMTFAGVAGTALQVPRGACSIQVASAQNIVFNMGGDAAHSAITVALQPGAAMPLGAFSQATFQAAGGGSIEWVSFEVEL